MDARAVRRPTTGREYRPSPITVTALLGLFLIGIATGAVEYAHRSAVAERHAPGTNAITIHVAGAIAAAAIVIGIQTRRSRRAAGRGPSPWAAPFSASAVTRLARTFGFAHGLSLPNVARVLATVPFVLVLAYVPFRMGAQVTGGVDPNATVNAWGGPTYLGALLAHWLDGVVCFYFAAAQLGQELRPRR